MNNKNYGKSKKGGKKSNYRNEILSLARKMGAVKRGLKNPDSAISEAYNSELDKKKSTKKSLF